MGDPMVGEKYTAVYLHTGSKSENQPESAWLKKLYQVLPPLYKANVESVLVLHPTIWLRGLAWFLKAFVTAKFFTRITYCKRLSALYSHISPSQIDLPPHVLAHDESKHGVLNPAHYELATPASSSSSTRNSGL